MGKRVLTIQEKVERDRKKKRVETMLLSGVRSQSEMAHAVGVSQSTISKWIKDIKEKWHEEHETSSDESKRLRTRQLDRILQHCMNEFERSRQHEETYVRTEHACGNCQGKGFIRDHKSNELNDCKFCMGAGKVYTETTKTKSKLPAAEYLRLAKDVITEAARIEGCYPIKMSAMSRIQRSAHQAGGEIEEEFQAITLEGPADAIINAKVAIETLNREMEKGRVRAAEKAIPIEAKPTIEIIEGDHCEDS